MKSVVTRHSGFQPYNKPGTGIYPHNNKRCISSHSELVKHPDGPVLKIKQGLHCYLTPLGPRTFLSPSTSSEFLTLSETLQLTLYLACVWKWILQSVQFIILRMKQILKKEQSKSPGGAYGGAPSEGHEEPEMRQGCFIVGFPPPWDQKNGGGGRWERVRSNEKAEGDRKPCWMLECSASTNLFPTENSGQLLSLVLSAH